MAQTPEGRVKEAVKKLLRARGIWYFMPVSNGMGVHGIPDIICCVPPAGKFLGIECKAPGKRGNTSPLQDLAIDGIRTARGWALVVDNATQVEEFLDDTAVQS